MITDKIFTWRGSEAFSVCADPMLKLMLAGRVTEIGGRTANVVDISLKSGKFGDLFRFLNNALGTS